MNGLIGNTDASGEVGRRVAERLARLDTRQRLIVQDPGQAPQLPGCEVATITGYGDTESMFEALAGVETLFLIPIREHPERVRLHLTAVDAAVAAGVRRIVYSSFLGAAPDATFTLARDHYATEEHIRSKGVAFTFVRGSAYLEVIRYIVGADGVIRGPAGIGRVAPVGRDDTADTATAILTSEGAHDGATYDVTGPEALSLHEIAEAFTRATGRRITYVDETLEDAWASRRAYGAPDWQVDAWVTTYLQIANGELDVVSDTVPRLTGHPAMSLREYLAAHPESFVHLMPS
ncbi:MAG TPA: SDR family oxidoreductase [Solirubrobacteraceae bacterium]|nr:SDR family oxidoreductase [Solirubrobacteraceae bacterium]